MWDKSVKQNYKPRKRANSANARYSTSMMQDNDHHRKSSSPVMIQMGNTWLAGGHDLHYITKKTNQMKLSHIPGWKQGLEGRPQSSKFVTERKQKKIRNINSARPRLEHCANCHLVPSPASSMYSLNDACSSYQQSCLHQAAQHNITTQRVTTPPSYQGQAHPPSPLNMTVK